MEQNLQAQIDSLKEEVAKLKSVTTIPYDVEQAFRARLTIDEFARLAPSTKTAASETQAVNESGSSSYSVAKAMDGFREEVIAGTTIYIPYYI